MAQKPKPARRVPRVLPLVASLASLATGHGASAGEPDAPRPENPATFTKDVAPIVFRQCASCHRPGEVAPFPLLSYRDVSKRAEQILAAVEGRVMPPWKAATDFGHFADERRLGDGQVATIARWVRDGAPEGDPADLPPAPTFTPGWQVGEPDMVVEMAEPYELAAEGRDEYRCFVIPLQIPPGKYLRAVEYRPGNRKIVHHAVLSSMPAKQAQEKLAAGGGKSFASGLAPPGQLLPGQLAFWTPGMLPRPLPDGLAAKWPGGADLVLQLHLHPSGKPESERSRIGLHFTDAKPTDRLRMEVMNNEKVNIQPGEADHAITETLKIPADVDVYGVFPHMHLIGRTVSVTARMPDGASKSLISIEDWDFNWQYYYEYATPVRLPAGTVLEARWTYDNTAANPANPRRPPQLVTYGEQTADEMAIVILDLIRARPAP